MSSQRLPIPADFGLTEADVQLAKSKYAVLKPLIKKLAVSLWIIQVATFWLFGHPIVGLVEASLLSYVGYLLATKHILKFVPKGAKINEYFVAKARFYGWLKRTSKDFWNKLHWRQFEKEVGKLFQNIGFVSKTTKSTGDGGVDVWLMSEDGKSIVQCKAYQRKVGVSAVRELFGAMHHFEAHEGILVSRSGYSREAYGFAKGKNIKMLTLEDIIKMQTEGTLPMLDTNKDHTPHKRLETVLAH